jgi:ribosomal protein L16 Arg81 hydroxylase
MALFKKKLPEDWQEWVADCIMMQVETDDVLNYLVEKGVPQKDAQKALKDAQAHPYVLAGTKIARQLKRRDWLLQLYRQIWENSDYTQEIERRERIGRDEFYNHYHANNRPVILTNMLDDWRISKEWTPDYFKAHYGDRDVQVVRMDETKKRYHDVLSMREYVETITTIGHSNQWYMTNSNTPYNQDVIGDLYQEVDPLPELLNPDNENPYGWLLFGPEGTLTDLHFDLSNALYCQVYGRKHFKIIAPHDLPYVYPYKDFLSLVDMEAVNYERFPLFERAKMFDFVLNPGEMLFLPVGWWHSVVALDVSISLSFNNFYGREGFHLYRQLFGTHPEIDD